MRLTLQLKPEEHVSLSEKTYYRIGGKARYFIQPENYREVAEALLLARKENLPIYVIGAGSNTLCSDEPCNAVVICLGRMRNWVWESESVLFAEAGVSNTEIAEISMQEGRAGASWMYRMPGMLGGTVRMNARCYGGEISQIVTKVLTCTADGLLRCYKGKDVFRGYKDTILMHSPEIVCGAWFELPQKEDSAKLLEHMKYCEQNRNEKHHFDYPSCGSTFKNNYAVGRPSGQVFEACGFKGKRAGGAQVSPAHANFIFNVDHAKAMDVLTLASDMRKTALEKEKADLELEVQPMGDFSEKIAKDCVFERYAPLIKLDENKVTTGFLSHPQFKQERQETTFPFLLCEVPFLDYFLKKNRHASEVVFKCEQLTSCSQAYHNPGVPFLRWSVALISDKNPFQLVPTEPAGTFLDALWNYSVSELFISHPSQPHYAEFEMTPREHWIAIAFDDVRKRVGDHQTPSSHHWSGVTRFTQAEQNSFGMDIPFSILQKYIDEKNQIKLQGCLSLGNENYALAPHWGAEILQHKADFHQPSRYFQIQLR